MGMCTECQMVEGGLYLPSYQYLVILDHRVVSCSLLSACMCRYSSLYLDIISKSQVYQFPKLTCRPIIHHLKLLTASNNIASLPNSAY